VFLPQAFIRPPSEVGHQGHHSELGVACGGLGDPSFAK